jgi:type II secretory pathway predicted ATPase ExeA
VFRVSYPDQVFETQGTRRVARAVKELVNNPGATLALVGDIGAGKTVAAWSAFRAHDDAKVIWVQQPDREHLTINCVVASMVRQLKGKEEGIRRDVEARLEQLRGLLGRASETTRVCLVVDDAHALPITLYRQLKRLMELHYAARKGLFSLLLIGNPELQMRLAAVPEKLQRARFVELKKLTASEAVGLAQHTAQLGKPEVADAACERVAKRSQNPLEIASLVAAVQDQAWELGEKKVTVEMVDAWLASSVRSLVDSSPDTQKAIAEHLGWSPAKVSRVIAGKYPNAGQEQDKLISGLHAIRQGSPIANRHSSLVNSDAGVS